MAAKFTQEPFKIDEDGDIVVDVGTDMPIDTMVAQIHGMDGGFRGIQGPETDANRRLFLHSQALYRLAEMIVVGCTIEYAAKEARRLVAAIDGVKAKLEWKPSGLGKWESRGANEYVDWRIRVDMQDGTFSVTRDEGGTVTKSGYPSLAEAKAYCQEQEDKAHG